MRKLCSNAGSSFSLVAFALSAMAIFAGSVLLFAASPYESPRVLKAADILPKELLSGPYHQVDATVVNDGYMNLYTVRSPFGELKAMSTAALRLRIREFEVIQKMSEFQKTDSYKEAVAIAGKKTISGMKTIVTRPVKTMKGAVSGVGKIFQRTGESLKSEKGAGEDNTFEQLLGFSEAKREIAQQFGVDVYSSNEILQEHLEDIAWANFGGKMSVKVVKAFIPGGVGIALSVSDNAQMLNDAIMSSPPSELKVMNRKKLGAMGVDPVIIEIFMDNANFTPRYQTQLVSALDVMKKTQDRDVFVKFAALTKSEDVAFFRQRSALKYAAYHKKKAPIQRFIPLGQFVAASTGERLIFIVPVDHLIWSENTARIVEAMDRKIKSMPQIKQKELWLSGGVSAVGRQRLAADGWKIFENSDDQLLADFMKAKST